MTDKIKSIKQRLKNISEKTGRDYNFILQLYFQERLIARLSNSVYSSNFILKGGLFLYISFHESFRPTKDIDFLGSNILINSDNLKTIFTAISKICLDDGVLFDPDSICAEKIKEGADYEGVRVKILVHLGNIRLPVTIDVGFGDIITPEPIIFSYPVLLESTEPKLLAYNYETVIAEKSEAICKLGVSTSRMKDFYDIIFILDNYEINQDILKDAINNTFTKRKTLKSSFNTLKNNDLWENHEIMWSAFENKLGIRSKTTFKNIRHQIIEKLGKYF